MQVEKALAALNEKQAAYEVAKLEPGEHPQTWSKLKRWAAVLTICMGALLGTCASSAAAFAETGIAKEFDVSKEVTILGVSVYVMGLGLGPLIAGPISEVLGRSVVYQGSYLFFFAFSWPVAFAPSIQEYIVFRFFTGFAASAFLSVAGGSVADMFSPDEIATPLAIFTISPFLGPEIGPLYSGFVNQFLDWRWTFHILTIWAFIETIALFLFVPETFVPVLLKRKAERLRKTTGDLNYWAPQERSNRSFGQALFKSATVPFVLTFREPMAFLINFWNSLILGILYLTFQAFPVVFAKHNFNMWQTGLTFLGIFVGMLIGLSTQPYWNYRFRKFKEYWGVDPPPEFRLAQGMVGGLLIPMSLFWLAFTTYPSVHYAVPIVASVPFGTGVYFAYTSSFTYLVVAYRSVAANALAANSAMRSCFAASFPLFAGAMYSTLGTVGATALLAGLTLVMAPLPFIFYKKGGKLRERSTFASA
ncbi:MFS general substrate transporter [Peniophora sp. CONT]|nr:MFS general substrate transporter [Peniophora sp. CONT]